MYLIVRVDPTPLFSQVSLLSVVKKGKNGPKRVKKDENMTKNCSMLTVSLTIRYAFVMTSPMNNGNRDRRDQKKYFCGTFKESEFRVV